jgi:RimJ/RimL family protein N-acetyltransferase
MIAIGTSVDTDEIIDTRRLRLRRMHEDDRSSLADMGWLDAERVMIRSVRTPWPWGFLAVTLNGSGEFCGICGLLKQQLDHGDEVELAYHLRPRYHGRGIATEAARGVMEYAFANLDLRRIVSLIRPDNLPSRRVAEKNGLCHERDVVFHGDVHGMHVILKQDWEIIR